ncbi:hypothetical protein [Bradyrhizobium sp. DOA1]|uniref:hypothetical protein n=1 Tax=Bradyrhizobium sp. DOA1 TaxID=1126616 RepID=UPI000B33EBFB|nr:hypothetical protein [Bradyrhizobium sp. DOA1]
MTKKAEYLPKADEVEPIEPGFPADLTNKVNKMLSDYRKTRNVLFLWEAARVCLTHDLILPKVIRQFLFGVCDGLLDLVDRKGGRADVADVALGTLNDQGGYSMFERYKAVKDRQELLQLIDRKMEDYLGGTKTQDEIFNEVAKESDLSVEHVKKVYSKANPAFSGLSVGDERRARERLRRGAGATEL